MNTVNNLFNNSVINLKQLEQISFGKEKFVLNDVPKPLQKLLPNFTLLSPQGKPGIYGFYFPLNNKIYWGESKNVSFEMSMYRSKQRSQIYLNELFDKNQNNVYSFAIYQGEQLADNLIRKRLEKELIRQTLEINVNVQGTPQIKQISQAKSNSNLTINSTIGTGSLEQYKIKAEAIPFERGKGCIYIFLNPKTLNFYIGESSDFIGVNRIKSHKDGINSFIKRKAQNQPLTADLKYERIVEELPASNNTLVFACLRTTENLNKTERVKLESQIKLQYQQAYGNRMYNKLNNTSPVKNLKQTDASIQRIRAAALLQDITIDTKAYPCICEGVWYNSAAEACRAYGFNAKGGLRARFKGQAYPDFICLKDINGKKLPENNIIRQKLEEWQKNFIQSKKQIIKR